MAHGGAPRQPDSGDSEAPRRLGRGGGAQGGCKLLLDGSVWGRGWPKRGARRSSTPAQRRRGRSSEGSPRSSGDTALGRSSGRWGVGSGGRPGWREFGGGGATCRGCSPASMAGGGGARARAGRSGCLEREEGLGRLCRAGSWPARPEARMRQGWGRVCIALWASGRGVLGWSGASEAAQAAAGAAARS